MLALQTDKICRACLREDDKMIDMHGKDIYQKFLRFTNLTVEKEIPNVSLNLCQSCEQKLNISFDFREECLKSHKILLNYIIDEVIFSRKDDDSEATAIAVVDIPEVISFTQVNRLKDHLKMHKSGGDADKQLAAFKLKKHERMHTRKLYNCRYCDKKFWSHSHLVGHECIQTGEIPYVCQVCGKRFTVLSSLKTHMSKLHKNKGRQLICNICEKKFYWPFELRRHLLRHTGEKPFVCTECGKGFTRNSDLTEHNQTHSNLRPYQCKHCKKSFKTKTTFRCHMWIHSGQKPYKCDRCSYACRRSIYLTQHMNKKHPLDNLRHVCLMCKRTFTTYAMLKCHIHTHEVNFLEI